MEDKVENIFQKSKKENKHTEEIENKRKKYLKMRRLVKQGRVGGGKHPNDMNFRKKNMEKWRNGITKTYNKQKQKQKT